MPFLGFVNNSGRPSFPLSKDGLKDQLRHVTSKQPSTTTLGSYKSGNSDSSSTSFKARKKEQQFIMDHRHSLSLGSKFLSNRRSSHGSSKSPKMAPRKSAKIEMRVESPPLVSFNTPASSSGALFSALLDLDVIEPELAIESFELKLLCVVAVKKPVHPKCADCMTKTTELKKWNFAEEKLRLKQGHHKFPFSYLFPGHLPATTHAALTTLDYCLSAVAKTATGEDITFQKSVVLSRAVLPGLDKHSLRVFPPTNITVSVNLNPCVHPIGEFPVTMKLSGITTKNKESQVRWRLRKMNWRIEEHQKMISPACAKHALKLGGDGKGINHEDTRTIGAGDIEPSKSPWKTDFASGEIDAEFTCAVNPNRDAVCDVEAPNGLSVTHNLILEMVVTEEWHPKNKPNAVTSTGAARILRTQFHLMLTNTPGLGVPWDEETPPVYEDVPPSPPGYAQMTDFDIEQLSGEMEEVYFDPHTGLSSTTATSSSSGLPPYSTESALAAPRSRGGFTVDDLLSGPVEREASPQAEAEDDVQVVRS